MCLERQQKLKLSSLSWNRTSDPSLTILENGQFSFEYLLTPWTTPEIVHYTLYITLPSRGVKPIIDAVAFAFCRVSTELCRLGAEVSKEQK